MVYARNYEESGKAEINLPHNYDGTALKNVEKRNTPPTDGNSEPTSAEPEYIEAHGRKNPWEEPMHHRNAEECDYIKSEHCAPQKPQKRQSLFGGLFDGALPFFSGIGLPKIGTEEILIIGAALFLLLSKDGDKECAIILLLLLLVN